MRAHETNGPEEQIMGWYYYLEDKIRFPFQAKCIVAKVVSPLRKAETVEVQRIAPEDACSRYASADPLARSDDGSSLVTTGRH
jgi:hypothetical protein